MKNYFVNEAASVRDAMKCIDDNGKRMVVVVDENNKLLGTFTDGDMRRWILSKNDLNAPVALAMENKPKYVFEEELSIAYKMIADMKLVGVPILDLHGTVTGIVYQDEINPMNRVEVESYIENDVVIMAGGVGTRLFPFTKVIPKPLIPVGNVTITEKIISNFRRVGCSEFILSINYKKELVKSYIDSIVTDYNVTYVEEEKPLGTAGSLKLLRQKMDKTFFVTNCDILVEADYIDLLKYHKKFSNKITIVASLKTTQIPYGVVEVDDDGCVDAILEKPEFDHLVNTGMYLMEPDVLDLIPEGKVYNVTDLITDAIDLGLNVGTYPVSDKAWSDMGQLQELKNMIIRLDDHN